MGGRRRRGRAVRGCNAKSNASLWMPQPRGLRGRNWASSSFSWRLA